MNTVAHPSATGSATATSPATTFPNELLFLIAAHMDPDTDRDALLSLLCVSQVAWEAAARVLYRHMSLDTDKVATLLHPDGNISDRTRRALTFTKSLQIITPLRHAELYSLWTAAEGAKVPKTPLFPRAEQVHLIDRPDIMHPFTINATPRDRRPSEGVRVFNRPDMCITGYMSHRQYLLLPWCSLRAITYHDGSADWVMQYGLPDQWTSLRIFDHTNTTHFLERWGDSLGGWEKKMSSEKRKDLPPVRICVTSGRAEYRRFLADAREEDDWVPTPESRMQVEWYPVREGYKCASCTMCGEFLSPSSLMSRSQMAIRAPQPLGGVGALEYSRLDRFR